MATFKECFAAASTAAGRALKDGELDDIFAAAQGRIARNMRNGMTQNDAISEAGTGLAAEYRAAAAREKQTALMNLQKRVAMRNRIEARAAELAGKDGVPDVALAMRNEIVAVNTPTDGSRMSTEAMGNTRSKQYAVGVESDLRKAGLLKVARDGTLEREWGRELYELSMQDAGKPSNVGVTRNAQALQIAQILRKYQTLMKDRLNREGAWIGDLPGYITHQSHDPMAIYKAGVDKWVSDIMPKLGPDTFDGVDDPEKMLRATWGALATGVHMDDSGGVGMKDPAFSGPSNLAKKLSENRVLHFKDAESWLDYQHQYGTQGSLFEHVLGSFKRGAQQEALLDRWGTNPRAEFDNTIRAMSERFRDSDPASVIELTKQQKNLEQLFGYVDGKNNRVVNQQVAQIASGTRMVASMAKLGGVLFTHLGAAFSKAAELRYQGVGLLEGYSNFASSFFKGVEGADRQHITDLTLAGAEGSHGRLLAGGWMDDSMPGTMSKISNKYFQMTGLSYTLAVQKGGAGDVMAARLGSLIGKGFDALPPQTQRGLKIYGISPAEWDTLRNAPDHTTAGGRTYLTPDAATRSTETMSDKARDMLGLKLATYYSDVADRSIITPGAAEKNDLLRGTLRGTPEGEALRFLAQFKTWPTAALRQGLGRELNGGQGVAGAISGIMHLAIAGTAFGYLRMMLGDLTKGITPRDPRDPTTMLAALAQGGGAGIFGDFLFGETNRFGGGLADTLAGPVLGQTAGAIMKIWNDAKSGDANQVKDIGPSMLKLGLDNTPFINLFYARSALNYLFLNSAMESMNPGYLRRAQQSLRKSTGQVHYLSPESHLKPFGR